MKSILVDEEQMNIDSYDWNDLYKKAEEFIHIYVPDAVVNNGTQTFFGGRPRVEIIFPEKGHKANIEILNRERCFRRLKGSNIRGSRIVIGEIVFNEDGTLN